MKTPFVRRAVVALLGILSCAQLAFAQSAVQTVIVNDTFADGDRATAASLPDSAQWFSSGGASTLTVTNNALAFTTLSTAGRHALAHFPAQSLAVGESIEFSFDFRTSTGFIDQASGLRFGLYSTNGNNPVTEDNVSSSSYIGYAITTNGNPTVGGSNPTQVRKRSTTSGQLITSTGAYAIVGNTGGVFSPFAANITYRATLLVERLEGDSVRITLRYTGGALPTYTHMVIDSVAAVMTFDTLAIAIGSSGSVAATTQFEMDNVSVIHIGPTPPAITAEPVAVTVPHGDPAFFSVGISGSAPLTYQWQRNGEMLQGQNSPILWFQNVSPADAGDYTLVVTNAANTATSLPATLTVDTTPVVPSVRAQPLSQTVLAGGSARFEVTAGGTPPYSYQWLRNGVPLPNATSSSLQLDGVTASQAGLYSVVIGNETGSVTSNAATLTVTPALTVTTLLNDTFSDADISTQDLPASAAWLASSTSAPALAFQSGALLVPAGKHALAYFTNAGSVRSLALGEELAATFNVNFSVVGQANGGFRVGLYNSNGATRASNGTNSVFAAYSGVMAATSVRFPTLDSSSTLAAYDALSLRFRIPNYPAGSASTALISTTAGYSASTTFGRHSQSFVAGMNYQFRLSVLRVADGKLRVTFTVNGGSLHAYGCQGELDSTIDAFDSFAILSNSSNGSTFTVDNFVVTHTAAPATVAPTILTQPQSASVNPGESVTFSADATGTPVPTFQWRKGGVAIEGATGASYTIAAAAAGDAGDYDVVATNSAGSATSNVAVLTVASPLSALQTWRVTYFGAPEATGDAADLADPDADGLVNLVEYALGFDPKEADVAALPATASADGQWVFNYTRPVDRSDLTYTVQVSTNLQSWTTVAQEQAAVVGDTATWRAVYPQTGNPNAFFRLSVSLNAP